MKRSVFPVSVVALSFGLGGIAQACVVPSDWLAMTGAAGKPVNAAIALNREKIVVGEPFSVNLAVCSAGAAPIDRVTIDAMMPRHRHGMNYKPRMTDFGGGRYRVKPFVFHMPGLWRVVVTTYRKDQSIQLQRDFQVQ